MTAKFLIVLGTRPEAIKLAPIIKVLQDQSNDFPGEIQSFVCVTAQHRQMLDQVLRLFHITPDYDLDIMQHMQSPAGVFSIILEKLSKILSDIKPDWMLVQGDTTTTIAAAMTAFYANVKIGYVEAGLRTYNKHQPFPEEIHRRLTSLLADLYFAPTEHAYQNLLQEGVRPENVVVTGNTIIDSLRYIEEMPLSEYLRENLKKWGFLTYKELREEIKDGVNVKKVLRALPAKIQESLYSNCIYNQRIVLVTAHRRENLGSPLQNICLAIKKLANYYDQNVHFIYPVHLNPQVWEPVHQILGGISNITLIPPLDYLSLIQLMKNCSLIITDSGGIQEEAPYFGIPVILLREMTERLEGVHAGVVKIVGTDCDRIVSEAKSLLDYRKDIFAASQTKYLYGDGRSAVRIVKALWDKT